MTEPSLLEFPCEFPLKALGKTEGDDFQDLVLELVRRHAPEVDASRLRVQDSRQGRYCSVTVTIRAQSQGQLDAIYRELTAHPRVVMAL